MIKDRLRVKVTAPPVCNLSPDPRLLGQRRSWLTLMFSTDGSIEFEDNLSRLIWTKCWLMDANEGRRHQSEDGVDVSFLNEVVTFGQEAF